jgi:hypothetical protein
MAMTGKRRLTLPASVLTEYPIVLDQMGHDDRHLRPFRVGESALDLLGLSDRPLGRKVDILGHRCVEAVVDVLP